MRATLRPGPLAVFLDYDGTLTEVRARPADAVLEPAVRDELRRLSERCFVAVVTGRGLADVRALVGLPQLCYAANHGHEIEGPGLSFSPQPQLRQVFEAIRSQVDALTADVPGVTVEHKGLSVAIHVRLVEPSRVPAIEAGVDALVAEHPQLRKGTGKMVLELRPAIDWHKGAAVRWLCDRRAEQGQRPTPLYVGDDRTDEDALVAVAEHGVGIVVGQPQWPSAARYGLRDPAAVLVLLRRVVATLDAEPENFGVVSPR